MTGDHHFCNSTNPCPLRGGATVEHRASKVAMPIEVSEGARVGTAHLEGAVLLAHLNMPMLIGPFSG